MFWSNLSEYLNIISRIVDVKKEKNPTLNVHLDLGSFNYYLISCPIMCRCEMK